MYLYDNFDVYQKLIDHNEKTGMQLFYYIDVNEVSCMINKEITTDDLLNFDVKDGYVNFELPPTKHPFHTSPKNQDDGWRY